MSRGHPVIGSGVGLGGMGGQCPGATELKGPPRDKDKRKKKKKEKGKEKEKKKRKKEKEKEKETFQIPSRDSTRYIPIISRSS